MSKLKDIVGNKAKNFAVETNIEKGQIFVMGADDFQHGGANKIANRPCKEDFCWKSPGNGCIQLEMWGAGGSGGEMCCCGSGTPGNPGTYLKANLPVDSSTYLIGTAGISCMSDSLCFKGCSEATCVFFCSPNGRFYRGIGNEYCVCFCAEGGHGGIGICKTGGSDYACFACQSFSGFSTSYVCNPGLCTTMSINCATSGEGCGIVCMVGPLLTPRIAYGGEINCNSGDANDPYGPNWSCIHFRRCEGRPCCQSQTVAIPPGIFSTKGSSVTSLTGHIDAWNARYSGNFMSGLKIGLGSLGRHAGGHGWDRFCYSGGHYCGCYETSSLCSFFLPPGVPGPGVTPCADVRDHGFAGGNGAVRITYFGT